MSKYREYFILLVILSVASLLRLWKFTEIPFIQDELSTLVRTDYDTVWQVITQAYHTDVHPVGVQLMVYGLTKIFGYSFWVIKLPFIIAGICSVLLTYLIGRKWFSPQTGLLSAALLAVIQYHIMYSQSIRPYGIGTFFILCLIWFWGEIVLFKKWSKFNQILLVLTAVLAYSSHYFANILGGVILLSGLLFIPNEKRKPWLLLIGITVAFYLPQLPVFVKHLLFGTPGEWLAAPDKLWLFDYFYFIFHFNWAFCLIGIGAVLLGFFSSKIEANNTEVALSKRRIILVSWFLFPLVLGYVYSILRSPMLQFSVVLFGFPALLIGLFSFHGKWKYNWALVMAILVVGSYTLIYGRQYYSLYYQGGYDIPYQKSEEARLALQDEFPFVYRSSDMVKFYLEKKFGRLSNVLFVEEITEQSLSKVDSLIESQAKPTRIALAIPWAIQNDWVADFRIRYPYLLDVEYGHLKKYVLLSKRKNDQLVYPIVNDTVLNESISGNSLSKIWNINSNSKLENDLTGQLQLKINGDEFPCGFSDDYTSVFTHPNQLLDLQLKTSEVSNNVHLVLEIQDGNGEKLVYQARTFDSRIRQSEWVVMRFEPGKTLHEKAQKGRVNIYLWNAANSSFAVSNFGFTVRKENPITFWLLEDFKN